MSRARDVASLLNTVATDDELTSGLSEKLSYEFASASPTTTASGFLWYDSNSSPAAPKFWDGAAFQALTSGKILQIVRATDGTRRTTTSTTFTDASMSVTITPTKSTSEILIIPVLRISQSSSTDDTLGAIQVTDSSDNAISGCEEHAFGATGYTGTSSRVSNDVVTAIARATPATTSAVTYKIRFRSFVATCQTRMINDQNTGQIYAIEVSA